MTGAKILLSDADTDGASSRAYYAMYDCALASLLHLGMGSESLPKTHNGVIAAFGLHVGKLGHVARQYGRTLNQVHELRLIADYSGEPVSYEQAAWAVAAADDFLQTIKVLVGE